MSSKQSTIDFITDQLQKLPNIRSKKMFGEYAIYCDEKVVALVCDDTLFIKPTTPGEKYLDITHGAPPYSGAKNYLKVPDEKLEDATWLSEFIQITADALPLPKVKKKKLLY